VFFKRESIPGILKTFPSILKILQLVAWDNFDDAGVIWKKNRKTNVHLKKIENVKKILLARSGVNCICTSASSLG
jgi:hypothetical protein